MKTSMLAIAGAARSALQWRLLLLWAAFLLLPTLIISAPVWRVLAANLDYSADAARLAQTLDLVALSDLRDLAVRQRMLLSYAGLLGVGVTLLIAPLLTGMAIAAARSDTLLGVRALLAGGLQHYLRMLRMAIWAVVPLTASLALGAVLRDTAGSASARALVESDANIWQALAALGALVLVVVAHAGVDAGRAMLALDTRRASAVAGWWAGVRMLARQPLRTFGVYLAITLAGMTLAALLALLLLRLSSLSEPYPLAVFALTQVTVAVLAWMRIARLFALIRLARTTAPHTHAAQASRSSLS